LSNSLNNTFSTSVYPTLIINEFSVQTTVVIIIRSHMGSLQLQVTTSVGAKNLGISRTTVTDDLHFRVGHHLSLAALNGVHREHVARLSWAAEDVDLIKLEFAHQLLEYRVGGSLLEAVFEDGDPLQVLELILVEVGGVTKEEFKIVSSTADALDLFHTELLDGLDDVLVGEEVVVEGDEDGAGGERSPRSDDSAEGINMVVREDTKTSLGGQVDKLAEDVSGVDAVAVGVDDVGLVFGGGGAVFKAEDGIVGMEEGGHTTKTLLIVRVRTPTENAADRVAREQVLVIVSNHGLLEEVKLLRVGPSVLLTLVRETEFGEDVVHKIPEVHVALDDLAVGLLLGDRDPLTADELNGLELIQIVTELVSSDVMVGHHAEDSTNLGAGKVHNEALTVGGLNGEDTLTRTNTSTEETPSKSLRVLTDV